MMDPKIASGATEPKGVVESAEGEPKGMVESAEGGIPANPHADAADLNDEPANVTPQEQKQYDTVVVKAMELLFSEDRIGGIVEKLKANTDNISGEIGHSAAMTLQTIARTVENQGQEVPEDVLYAAGQEVVSQLVDIASAVGLISKEQEGDVAEAALYEGLRIWGKSMGDGGKITDERQQESAALLQQAGIEQDTSKLPGHGPGAAPGAPAADPGVGGAPGQQPAGPPTSNQPPQGGIVNQAMGA